MQAENAIEFADTCGPSSISSATFWQSTMGVVFDEHGQEIGRFTNPDHAILAAAAPEMLLALISARQCFQRQLDELIQSSTNPETGLCDDLETQLSIQSDQDQIDQLDELIVAAGGTIPTNEEAL
jgi:hypothetical protein